MKGKMAFAVLSTACMLSLFTGTASAEESKTPVQKTNFTFSSQTPDFTVSKEIGWSKSEESTSFLPETVNEFVPSSKKKDVTPVFFPTESVHTVVKDGKVVTKQYLMSEPTLESNVQRILGEGNKVSLLEEVKDAKQDKTWYKVKVKDIIEVEVEGKKESKTVETVGYLSPEYIQLVDLKTQKEVEQKVVKSLEEQKQNLESEVKHTLEIEKEKERQALEQAQLEAERKFAEEQRLEEERYEREQKALEEQHRLEQIQQLKEAQKQREQQQLAEQKAEEQRILAEQRAEEQKKKEAEVKKEQPSEKPAEVKVSSNPSDKASSVISTAKQFMGVQYLFGAAPGRTDAFDCSSYTQYVFKRNGISLPRTAATQFQQGQSVSKDNLQPGDMVFFETYKAGASHVGIYIGDGQFIHASSKGVGISPLSQDYYAKRYLGAKRVM